MKTVPPAMAATRLPVSIAYLHFHAGTENFRTILVRAVAAARHTTEATWQPLRQAIAGDATLQSQTAVLGLIEESPTDIAVALAGAVWWAVESWLVQANHLTLLVDYLEKAPLDTGWTSWTPHRVNLSRYRVLLSYYERLLT
jgi:hypothetical protein